MINNAKGNTETVACCLILDQLDPPPEALGRMPLPLSGEIVTADVSPGGNEGARKSDRGDGWAIKNARCRKQASMVVS